MLDLSNAKLLVVAPHADDEVIGCGGLMSKVVDAGGAVYVLFLTSGETKEFGGAGTSSANERVAEIKRVMKKFKVSKWRIALPGNEYHLKLDAVPQLKLISEIESGKDISLEALKPDIIAFPYVDDYNQDHRAAATAALAACRPALPKDKHVPTLILSYEAPMSMWQVTSFPAPNFYVQLTPKQAEKKVEGMDMYTSQVRGKGHPRNSETLRALMQLRGSMLGEQYAEGFYAHKISVR